MIIKNFAEELNLCPVNNLEKEVNIQGVYIGDLLSIVMAKAKESYVWITIQTHINIVAIAELLDLACIIVVEDMEIEKETIDKATELGILLYKTRESAYEVCSRLHSMGIK